MVVSIHGDLLWKGRHKVQEEVLVVGLRSMRIGFPLLKLFDPTIIALQIVGSARIDNRSGKGQGVAPVLKKEGLIAQEITAPLIVVLLVVGHDAGKDAAWNRCFLGGLCTTTKQQGRNQTQDHRQSPRRIAASRLASGRHQGVVLCSDMLRRAGLKKRDKHPAIVVQTSQVQSSVQQQQRASVPEKTTVVAAGLPAQHPGF